ncbi:MAG: protein-L-isoaspartate(D-aspartate) O-methyltransferase [candidate division Zixibacteria bacterium]|nr:protein-L-isoaspartate(D-aspartate) O-methyltransferase [candidate division Zixibacteria bacterium]
MSLFGKEDKAVEDEYRRQRLQMVQRQLAGRDVRDPAVLDAMRRVPRHLFVPPECRHEAYDDYPLAIGYGQTISQPYIVASMTEFLLPDKSKRVFEIGTGSGYQTAVLAELFGQVVTVEIVPELSERAQGILRGLGYANIVFHVGDGLTVPAESEKFEAIIATAAPEIAPEELSDRLLPGGRLILPVGKTTQYLQLVTRDAAGKIHYETLYAVRFVPWQRQ